MEVWHAGATVPVGGPTQRAVLAALAERIGEAISADELADGIWGESDDRIAPGTTLKVHVARLRSALRKADAAMAAAIVTVPGGYRLDGSWASVDLQEVEHMLAEGRKLLEHGDASGAAAILDAALALYRGPALMDLRYFPFATLIADRFDELRVTVAEERFEARLALGDGAAIVHDLRAWIAEHPYRERLHGQLMRALYRSGQQSAALEAFEVARVRLAMDLGVEPGPELVAIRAQMSAASAAPAPASRLEPSPRLPLRASLTDAPPAPTLLGRDELLVRLERVAEEHSLITISGPGGIGKTALALGLLHRLVARFPDRAAFVDLATITRTESVVSAIAGALGLSSSTLHLLDRVRNVLAVRRIVLVLDNCEHLAADPIIGSLGEATSGLVIATSRTPLGVRGEWLVRLAPLPLPDADAGQLAAEPAVQLFLRTAAAVGGEVDTDPPSLATIAGLCRMVDGLPLAIELVAAQTRVETIFELKDGLGRRLPALTGRARDTPHRQRTMDAAVGWSLERLTAKQRMHLGRLAVFAGGFTAAAASAVLQLNRSGTLELLSDLLDASLLDRLPSAAGEARFRFLEPIRLVALARTEPGELATARRLHADLMASVLVRLSPAPTGIQRPEDLAELRLEHQNLLTALEHLAEADADRCADLLVWHDDYWRWTGQESELARLLDAALAHPGLSDRARCLALAEKSGLVFHFGAGHKARATIDTAIALSRQVRDDALLARVRIHEAHLAGHAYDSRRGVAASRAALRHARRAGDPRLLAAALHRRAAAYIYFESTPGEPRRPAGKWLTQALALARAGPMPLVECDLGAIHMSYLATTGAAPELVRNAARAPLNIANRFNAPERAATQANNVGLIAVRRGDVEDGRVLLLAALRSLDRTHDFLEALFPLSSLAEVEAALGRWRNFLVLLTAVSTLAADSGAYQILDAGLGPEVQSKVRAAEEALGPAAVAEARDKGMGMTYAQAVAFAFDVNHVREPVAI